MLGGALSALDGVTPERLNVTSLLQRVKGGVDEVILAMNATVEGQTTAHYLMDLLGDRKVTRLAHGVPVGGELDYLDEGTLSAASHRCRAGAAPHRSSAPSPARDAETGVMVMRMEEASIPARC